MSVTQTSIVAFDAVNTLYERLESELRAKVHGPRLAQYSMIPPRDYLWHPFLDKPAMSADHTGDPKKPVVERWKTRFQTNKPVIVYHTYNFRYDKEPDSSMGIEFADYKSGASSPLYLNSYIDAVVDASYSDGVWTPEKTDELTGRADPTASSYFGSKPNFVVAANSSILPCNILYDPGQPDYTKSPDLYGRGKWDENMIENDIYKIPLIPDEGHYDFSGGGGANGYHYQAEAYFNSYSGYINVSDSSDCIPTRICFAVDSYTGHGSNPNNHGILLNECDYDERKAPAWHLDVDKQRAYVMGVPTCSCTYRAPILDKERGAEKGCGGVSTNWCTVSFYPIEFLGMTYKGDAESYVYKVKRSFNDVADNSKLNDIPDEEFVEHTDYFNYRLIDGGVWTAVKARNGKREECPVEVGFTPLKWTRIVAGREVVKKALCITRLRVAMAGYIRPSIRKIWYDYLYRDMCYCMGYSSDYSNKKNAPVACIDAEGTTWDYEVEQQVGIDRPTDNINHPYNRFSGQVWTGDLPGYKMEAAIGGGTKGDANLDCSTAYQRLTEAGGDDEYVNQASAWTRYFVNKQGSPCASYTGCQDCNKDHILNTTAYSSLDLPWFGGTGNTTCKQTPNGGFSNMTFYKTHAAAYNELEALMDYCKAHKFNEDDCHQIVAYGGTVYLYPGGDYETLVMYPNPPAEAQGGGYYPVYHDLESDVYDVRPITPIKDGSNIVPLPLCVQPILGENPEITRSLGLQYNTYDIYPEAYSKIGADGCVTKKQTTDAVYNGYYHVVNYSGYYFPYEAQNEDTIHPTYSGTPTADAPLKGGSEVYITMPVCVSRQTTDAAAGWPSAYDKVYYDGKCIVWLSLLNNSGKTGTITIEDATDYSALNTSEDGTPLKRTYAHENAPCVGYDTGKCAITSSEPLEVWLWPMEGCEGYSFYNYMVSSCEASGYPDGVLSSSEEQTIAKEYSGSEYKAVYTVTASDKGTFRNRTYVKLSMKVKGMEEKGPCFIGYSNGTTFPNNVAVAYPPYQVIGNDPPYRFGDDLYGFPPMNVTFKITYTEN